MLQKRLDVKGLYKDVNEMPKDIRFPGELAHYVMTKVDEYLTLTEEKKCSEKDPTTYGTNSVEYVMWMNSLISMCWLLTNVMYKCEAGHCHNPVHKDPNDPNKKANCAIGSDCHSRFYENIVSSLEELFKYAQVAV